MMEMTSRANSLMSSFVVIPIDPLMNFFGGIFDKLYLQI